MALAGTIVVVLSVAGVVPTTLGSAAAADSGCTTSPTGLGGESISCPVEGGPSGTVFGTGSVDSETSISLCPTTSGCTPASLINPTDVGAVATSDASTQLAPGIFCISTVAFTGPITPSECTGPTMMSVTESAYTFPDSGSVPLSGLDDVSGDDVLGGPPYDSAFLKAADGIVYVQFGVIASTCTASGCQTVGLAYVGWQCGTAPHCSDYYGNVAVTVPTDEDQMPVGAIGGLGLAALAGFGFLGRQIRSHRRTARVAGIPVLAEY